MHTLNDKLYESKSNFNILSLNAQSINATFDEFQIAINQINIQHEVNIICIQESGYLLIMILHVLTSQIISWLPKGNIAQTTEINCLCT